MEDEYMKSDKNYEEIKKVCTDYIEGLYSNNGENIERDMHPELAKRNISENAIRHMTKDELVHRATTNKYTRAEIMVEVLDIYKDIATAKITSSYIDYAHLVKLNGIWQIINILWEFNK